jgi:hypothetical protein
MGIRGVKRRNYSSLDDALIKRYSSVDVFDESALVAVNDLGPAGESWNLSSLSYSRGKLYHRGLKHVVCIESPNR